MSARNNVQSFSELEDIYRGFNDASAAFYLGAEQQQRGMRAIQQMFAKGKVQSEELVQQLAEQVPGAVDVALTAWRKLAGNVNKDRLDFFRAIERGEIAPGQFLPTFGREMSAAFGDQAKKNADKLTASVNKLANAWDKFMRGLGRGVIGTNIERLLLKLARFVERFAGAAKVSDFTEEVKLFGSFGDYNRDTAFKDKAYAAIAAARKEIAYMESSRHSEVRAKASDLRKSIEEYKQAVEDLPINIKPKFQLSRDARRFFDNLVSSEFDQRAIQQGYDVFNAQRGAGVKYGSGEFLSNRNRAVGISTSLSSIRNMEEMQALITRSQQQFGQLFNLPETQNLAQAKEEYIHAVYQLIKADEDATRSKIQQYEDELRLIVRRESLARDVANEWDRFADQLGSAWNIDQVKAASEGLIENLINTFRASIYKATITDPLKAITEGFVDSILQSMQTAFMQSSAKQLGFNFGKFLLSTVGGFFSGSFFGGGAGTTSSVPGPHRHSGGPVNRTGYHKLIKGERVISNPQVAMAKMQSARPKVVIVNNSSQPVQAEAHNLPDGGMEINLFDMVDDMIANTLAKPGNAQETMLSMTGSRRPLLTR